MPVTSLEIKSAVPPALLDRGCVNVIGFDAIKSRAGARWPKLREGVVARLESLLRHALRSTDFFAPLNDSAYLVTMPGADPEEINIVCLRIAYDLYKNLLGHCDLGHIQVSVAKDAGDDGLSLESIAKDHVLTLAQKAGIHDLAPAPDKGAASGHVSGSAPQASGEPLRTLHSYIPIWDSRNEAITTYLCHTRAYRAAHNEPVQVQQLTGRDRAAVELSGLHQVIVDLEDALKLGRRVLLGVPFTFEMIGSPLGRMQLASACRHLLAEHRQYLLFMLMDVPRGVAHTRLADVVNTLRPFARSVMATVAPGSRWYTAYHGIGLQAIGMRAAQCAAGPGLQAEIAKLTAATRSARLGSFLYDVTSRDVLEMARDRGVRWFSGPAVSPAVQQPQAMTHFRWAEMTRQPLALALA
jgi:hypothetical protein